MVRSAINPIVARLPITLNLFQAATIANDGSATTTYTTVSNITAQVQLENNQRLMHKEYYQQNTIYKRFYIQSTDLTGLNRNLNTAGDYIVLQGLYYKIVELPQNFQTGWVKVIGAEDTDKVDG